MFCASATRGSTLPVDKVDQLQDKAQKELVMVRQRLDEALGLEKRSMRCGLIKKRRELISDMVKRHLIKPDIKIQIPKFTCDYFCLL